MRGAKIRNGTALALAGLLTLLTGCIEGRRYDQAICVLIDVSGTYADQKQEVVKVIKRDVLPGMVPGDTFIAILVDSQSYEKENVKSVTTLDARPSRANAQKLALARQLDAFASSDERSDYTDLPGAMMLGAEYLQEVGSASRVMLVFSDLQEELPSGARRQLRSDEFEGIQLVAMNVKRLEGDTADPEAFRRRITAWETRVERAGGAGWRTFMDSNKLADYLTQLRS